MSLYYSQNQMLAKFADILGNYLVLIGIKYNSGRPKFKRIFADRTYFAAAPRFRGSASGSRSAGPAARRSRHHRSSRSNTFSLRMPPRLSAGASSKVRRYLEWLSRIPPNGAISRSKVEPPRPAENMEKCSISAAKVRKNVPNRPSLAIFHRGPIRRGKWQSPRENVREYIKSHPENVRQHTKSPPENVISKSKTCLSYGF